MEKFFLRIYVAETTEKPTKHTKYCIQRTSLLELYSFSELQMMDSEEKEMEQNYGKMVWKTNQESTVHFAC